MQHGQQKSQQTLVPTKGKQIAKNAEEIHKVVKSHFNRHEIEGLLKIYTQVTQRRLDRTKFKEMLQNYFQMTDDLLMDRVFKAFDKDNDSLVNMEEWVKGMSVFLRGDREEKIRFIFDVYDLNGDGVITREEMFSFLKEAFIKLSNEEDPDEGIKDLVELTVKLLDFDKDGRVTYEDYLEVASKEVLLVEIIGEVFPEDKKNTAFQTLFTENPWHQ